MGLRRFAASVKGAFNRFTGKVAPTLYIDDIQQHFSKLFGASDDGHAVYHEIVSEYVHIDIHRLAPDENRPFYVLYSTGMSDLPMTFSDDTPWDYKKIHERAELFCLLPKDWFPAEGQPLSEAEERRSGWIIECMKTAARYPHRLKRHLLCGDLLRYSEDNSPFADNTLFSAAVLLQLNSEDLGGKYGDDFEGLYTGDNTYINLFCFIPLYTEEMKFRADNEGAELFKRLFGPAVDNFSQLIIDVNRKNVCFDKSI